jgi:hypothetical protein
VAGGRDGCRHVRRRDRQLIYSTHTGLIFARALYIGAGLFATGFFAYCVTALVCTLTGTLAEALAYSLLALLLPTLLLTGLGGQMLAFLSGNAYGIRNAYKYDLPAPLLPKRSHSTRFSSSTSI